MTRNELKNLWFSLPKQEKVEFNNNFNNLILIVSNIVYLFIFIIYLQLYYPIQVVFILYFCCSVRIELTKTITTLYSFIFFYEETSETNSTLQEIYCMTYSTIVCKSRQKLGTQFELVYDLYF